MAEIKTVGVIGAGQMGGGIAHVCALAGYDVRLHDVSGERIAAGLATISRNLTRQAARGMIKVEDCDATLSRIHAAEALEAVAASDLVIEAASENEDLKKTIFKSLTPHLMRLHHQRARLQHTNFPGGPAGPPGH